MSPRTREREKRRRGALRKCVFSHLGTAPSNFYAQGGMPRRIRLLLLLHLAVLLLGWVVAVGRVRKKAARTRSCLDLPEEILEQMFGRLSVGVMSAFHHALQLEPRDKLNVTCPITARTLSDGKTRLPVNLLSVSPWAYR